MLDEVDIMIDLPVAFADLAADADALRRLLDAMSHE